MVATASSAIIATGITWKETDTVVTDKEYISYEQNNIWPDDKGLQQMLKRSIISNDA
jgi:hypothetical protein